MVFSSVTFLFLFLPGVLALYLVLALPPLRRIAGGSWAPSNLLLLLASLFFYTWGEGVLVLVMLASTAVDYACGLVMAGAWTGRGPLEPLVEGGPRSRLQKGALVTSIVVNLSFLGVFKYYDFFRDSALAALGALGISHGFAVDAARVALPIGISFYTFQSMSYSIDVYRGRIAPTRSFLNFACFVTMFPQLVAGPIVRYREVAAQLVRRHLDLEGFAHGAGRFIVGLGKKVLVADILARTADRIYALPPGDLTCGTAWLGTVCFTLQLYFDFSGYSDMAIGLGRMLGFRFPENFRYPFIARSVREYWTRWHITLGAWFRDYLFFPLGGSRVSPPKVYRNLLVVFFLCGLWHGAGWTFILWGLFHGCFLMLERLGLGRVLAGLWAPLAHLYLCLVNVGSKVLFRSGSLAQAGAFYSAMAGFARGDPRVESLRLVLNPELCVVLAAAVLGCTPVVPALDRRLGAWIGALRGGWRAASGAAHASLRLAALFVVFLLSILWVANVTYTPFLYFRF